MIDEIEFGEYYKEPLVPFEGGFGYYGALSYSKDKDRVQCHFCGKLFHSITESHLNARHGMTVPEYRAKTGLSNSTALVSESTRNKLIDSYVKMNLKERMFTPEYWEKRKKNMEQLIESNIKRKGTKVRLEHYNKRGTCPDQLLEKIKDLSEKLHRTPTRKEFYREYRGRYIGIIYATFGSWVNAVRRAGMLPVSDVERDRVSSEGLIQYMQNFFDQYKRVPRCSDMERGLLPSYKTFRRKFGSINNARLAAGLV